MLGVMWGGKIELTLRSKRSSYEKGGICFDLADSWEYEELR